MAKSLKIFRHFMCERAHRSKHMQKYQEKKALHTYNCFCLGDVGERDFYANIVGSEQMKLKLIQNSRLKTSPCT